MSNFTLDTAPLAALMVKRDRKELTILAVNQTAIDWAAQPLAGTALDTVLDSKEGRDLCKKLKSPTPPTEASLPFADRWVFATIHGDENSYTLYLTDISSSKQAEQDMKNALAQADALAAQKSNFLATMSHEIRTPMQSVYGLLEMIELENPPSDILTMARTAKSSASGLLEILDDVLDFAKMDAHAMELDLFEVPLRTLARGTIEAMEVKVQGKPVQLTEDIAPDVPFVIVGDPKRLRQILINLMGNALKFTSQGSITIRISRDIKHITLPSKGVGLRFEIVDTGIGMSEEIASRLFRPFSQADNTTARKYGGTGLGLSICKKLVELMGGEIGVTSIEGKGSTFWFEIPSEEVDVNAQVLELPDLGGISVLSVEDHPMGAKEIVKSLRSMGATVEQCGTIKDALELIERRPFDVGVFDQGLPDGLGLDLVRKTMELRPFMGLILYTARDDAGLQHTLQSLGVTYLTKPASRIGLGDAVKDAAAKMHKMDLGTGPMRLLIAEDTASVRDVLQRQLDKLGVEATFVENGLEALKAVDTGHYGILFTDLHMPELDGYGVVKAIRERDEQRGRHFPIIALTADVQMAQRQVYMGHGFDECLLKPVSLGHFRRLLIRWGLLKDLPGEDTAAPQDKPAQANHAIDRAAIEEYMGGLDAGVIEMLHIFIEMTEPTIAKIQAAQSAGDYHALSELGHSLKGAARSACAMHLGDLAGKLQDDAAAGLDCAALISQIDTAFVAAKADINSL